MSKNTFQNKIVLVTGAAGSIGSALCRRIAKLSPKKLIILDCDETGIFDMYEELHGAIYSISNIRDREKIDFVFDSYQPDIVFHAAAYKHVALMEIEPNEAYKTNILGTENVLQAATRNKAQKFIFISSDKAVNPTCWMGKTKKAGEKLCLENVSKTKCIIVRFGNVMASRGSLVPILQKQIAENKNLTVTHPKMERYMMGIYEAVDLVLEASRIGNDKHTYVLDMGEPVKIDEFARTMIRISGKPLEIEYTNPKKGEKFSEELMTKSEKELATKSGNLWIIPHKATSSGPKDQ